MKKRKMLAMLLSMLLLLTMLPAQVFAEAKGGLGGTLQIAGEAKEGETLKADLSKVTPEKTEEKQLDFRWMKKTDGKQQEGKEEKPLGTDSSLKLTKEMVGLTIYLEAAPKAEKGLTGEKLQSAAVTVKEKDVPGETVESIDKTTPPPAPPTEEPPAQELPQETPPVQESPEPLEQPTEPLQEIREPQILTETLPEAEVGGKYYVTLEGADVEAWSLQEGTVLPKWLTFSDAGVLGTGDDKTVEGPAGEYTLTVVASNKDASAEKTLVLKVTEPAVYEMTAKPEKVDFGKLQEGYKEVKGQEILLENKGNQPLTFQELTAVNFTLEQIEGEETFRPGESLKLTLVPKSGLTKGVYSETIGLVTEEGIRAEVQAVVAVTTEEEPVYQIEASPAQYDFGSLASGYEAAPEAVEITVTNTGNQPVTLVQPVSKNYQVTDLSETELEPEETASFTIRPKEDLPIGNYAETIAIPSKDVAGTSVEVDFWVRGPKLLAIIDPAAITGLTNGVEKSAKSFGLPEAVQIKTDAGEKKAYVTWDVEGCKYDPISVEAQNVTVTGEIALPDGVENPDDIPLTAQIQVGIKAYVPRIPDVSELKINQISSDRSYKTNTSYSFSATGAGSNSSPRKGDVRYVPYAWKLGSGSYIAFADQNYSASLKSSGAGTYTLSVSFRKDIHDGSNWVADGSYVYKERNIKFIKDTVTLTPTAKPKKENGDTQKKPVATGDESPVGLWVAAAVLAVVAGGIVLGVRRRRSRR